MYTVQNSVIEFIYDPNRDSSQFYKSFTNDLQKNQVVDNFDTRRGLLIVGTLSIELWNRETHENLESSSQRFAISQACYNHKEGKLYVVREDEVIVIDVEHLDVYRYYYSPSGVYGVACDISGEYILYTEYNIIKHHFSTAIIKENDLLTLPTSSFSQYVSFFETSSVTNIFAAMIQITSSTSELRLYELSVDCDPSCKTCTQKWVLRHE